MAFPIAKYIQDAENTKDADLAVVISDSSGANVFSYLPRTLQEKREIDPRVGRKASLVALHESPCKRCLFINAPSMSHDFDDIRVYFELGKNVAEQLADIGSVKPAVFLDLSEPLPEILKSTEHLMQIIYLGMCQHLWQPLEARESLGGQIEAINCVYLHGLNEETLTRINAIESGKRLARDLCGTDPERMAPPGFAQYCIDAFKDTSVTCTVIEDREQIAQQYPLLYAVARASVEVERHQPRIIKLVYEGHGPITQCLYLAGKGITYDTGGADLKVNGHMAGMSRDKGGAASVAGLMRSIALLQPKGLKVVAEIGAVRNSIGAEAYVPDEIIKSHAGVRVRVGNTDAEGRMLLADLLSHLKQEALSDSEAFTKSGRRDEVNMQLFSVATLTGHAAISFGPYTALVENMCAKKQGTAQRLCEAGEQWADPCEQSLLRKEDFTFIQSPTKAADVLSSNNKPSVATVRGHQFPAAFLIMASGLDKHDGRGEPALAFTHLDIAGSGVENMDWQHGKPTSAGLTALLMSFI